MCARKVQLLGPAQVRDDTTDVPRFRSHRTIALLGFLLTEQRAIARDTLTAFFYPDEPLSKGRGNLRRDLHNLNQILPNCWETDRVSICFMPSSDLTLDIQHVQQLADARAWEAAAKQLSGDYLEGLYLDDCPEFETWLRGERERWRLRAESILLHAIKQLEQQGNYHQAIGYAQRLVQQMPWQEETHRRLMQLLALSGRRSEALRQFDRCKKALADELGVDISADTLSLYEEIKNELHYSPNRIPALVTPLFGRETELSSLVDMVTDPGIRLITITGMGGMGKTHLALGVAWQVAAGHFRDGVTFVPLAAEGTGEQVVAALAQALHLPLSSQPSRSASQQLVDFLRTKEVLLVLDNCEHLLDRLDIVPTLLEEAPQVRVLATSRERLRLHGEHLYALQGLDRAEDRADHPAAKLFAAAARRVQPDYAVLHQDMPAVNRICRLVDGMPLALQLAAAWTGTLSPETVADEIEGSLDILSADLRNLPHRHRSMLAVLEVTWCQLRPSLQDVLAALSVMRGTFDLDAAKTITAATPAMLAELVSHTLVHFDAENNRYRLHELIRQYGLERLGENPTNEFETRNRHCAHYYELLAEQDVMGNRIERSTAPAASEPDLRKIRTAWLGRVELEQDNLVAALEWALAMDKGLIALRLAVVLSHFWNIRGRFSDTVAYLSEAVALTATMPDSDEYRALELRIQLNFGFARVAVYGYADRQAAAAYDRVLALTKRSNADIQVFEAVWALFRIRLFRGDREGAQYATDRCWEIAQAMGQNEVLLQGHHARWGHLFYDASCDLQTVYEHAREGAALYEQRWHADHVRRFGDHDPGVCAYTYMARSLALLGYPDQAREHATTAIKLAAELGHPGSLVAALHATARSYCLLNDPEEVDKLLNQAQVIIEKSEMSPYRNGMQQALRGWVLTEADKPALGLSLVEYAFDAWDHAELVVGRPMLYLLHTHCLHGSDRRVRGLDNMEKALAMTANHTAYLRPELLRMRGVLFEEGGNIAAACTSFELAMASAQQMNAKTFALRAAVSLARLRQMQGKTTEATDLLSSVYGWFTEGFDTHDLRDARALLDELRAQT